MLGLFLIVPVRQQQLCLYMAFSTFLYGTYDLEDIRVPKPFICKPIDYVCTEVPIFAV
jgi:hypothetical protein